MDEAERPRPLDGTLETFIKRPSNYAIYTHSARTRNAIMAIWLAYLVTFCMLLRGIFVHFRKLEDLPPVFARMAEDSQWLAYIIAGFGIIIALALLVYFLWAVIDIWGLQVWCSDVELRVQNTITQGRFARYMGTGALPMEYIRVLRGGKFWTHVSNEQGVTLRFSPVEKVDTLVGTILARAPHAVIEEDT